VAKGKVIIGVLLLSSFIYLRSVFRERPSTVEVGESVKVVTYETRVVYDTVFVDAAPISDIPHSFIDTLKSFIGLQELTGNNDHPLIDKFFDETCGLRNNPWCASVVGYSLKVNNHDLPETLQCWSPSYFPKDRITWRKGDNKKLRVGDVFGIYFPSKGRVAHVGVIYGEKRNGWVMTLEGNTTDSGGRDGNAFHLRRRHKSQIYITANWTK